MYNALFYPFVLILGILNACQGQTPTHMTTNTVNPLLCDPVEGICATPASKTAAPAVQKPLRLVYFTDPICSSCWGIEPQLRKLKLEYGHLIDIEYHMGGLLPSWDIYNSGGISKPSDVAHHWDEVSAHYGMPIDGDVWLEDPLPSSYPPSIAFKAAQLQDEHKAQLFMRRIREMVFLEKKNITKWEHLAAAANEVGLNAELLKTDMEGKGKAAFEADLALARSLGVRGFPTIFIKDAGSNQLTVYGFRPYAQYEMAVQSLCPEGVKKTYDTTPEALFAVYPTLTTREFAELSGLGKPEAEKTLKALVEKGFLTEMRSKNGPIWAVKNE